MGSRASRPPYAPLPPRRAFGIFSLMAMKTATHYPRGAIGSPKRVLEPCRIIVDSKSRHALQRFGCVSNDGRVCGRRAGFRGYRWQRTIAKTSVIRGDGACPVSERFLERLRLKDFLPSHFAVGPYLIPNWSNRKLSASASSLICSSSAVPKPWPELADVRSRMGWFDRLAACNRAVILRE